MDNMRCAQVNFKITLLRTLTNLNHILRQDPYLKNTRHNGATKHMYSAVISKPNSYQEGYVWRKQNQILPKLLQCDHVRLLSLARYQFGDVHYKIGKSSNSPLFCHVKTRSFESFVLITFHRRLNVIHCNRQFTVRMLISSYKCCLCSNLYSVSGSRLGTES